MLPTPTRRSDARHPRLLWQATRGQRWFVWNTRVPAFCLVGGTGVVPAVAMLRTARRLGRADQLAVVAVGRNPEMLPYVDELRRAGAMIAFTRYESDHRSVGPPTRDECLPMLNPAQLVYVCGSPTTPNLSFSSAESTPPAIRVEQFGTTG